MPRQFPRLSVSEVDEKVKRLAERVYASAINEENTKDVMAMFSVAEDCPIGLHQAKEQELRKEIAEEHSAESVKRLATSHDVIFKISSECVSIDHSCFFSDWSEESTI